MGRSSGERGHCTLFTWQLGSFSPTTGAAFARRCIRKRFRRPRRGEAAPRPYSTGAVNRLRGEEGELWQPRFFDRALRTVKEYNEKAEYIHLNPVRAGLVSRPEDWRWSSYNEYAGMSAEEQKKRCSLRRRWRRRCQVPFSPREKRQRRRCQVPFSPRKKRQGSAMGRVRRVDVGGMMYRAPNRENFRSGPFKKPALRAAKAVAQFALESTLRNLGRPRNGT